MNISPRSLALPLLAAVLLGPSLCAQPAPASSPSAATPNTPPALYLGTAWYPEQWPESRWDADLTLMEAAHIRFVRIGEFAWSNLEPTEGHYDLDWLDRAIRAAARHHIAVVIGTPSAAPPAWLTTKYPETLRIMEDGRRDQHGNRQQFNWADPKYRELVYAIDLAGGQALRPRPQRHRLADRQRVRQRILRPHRSSPIPGLAQSPLRHTRQPQQPLDHRLLEPDLHRLVADPHRNRLRQPRPSLKLEALRLRHLAQLPEEPAQRPPPQHRPPPVHHHQHDGLLRRLRSLHRLPGPRPRLMGRLRRHRPTQPRLQRRRARPHPRLPPQKLLGHGDPTRLRQLVTPTTTPSTKAPSAPWPGTT